MSLNILIVRLSAIGDVAMASGLIASLRQRYPRARLCWLVEPAAAPLLQQHPDLDEVIVWPRQEWRRLWREHQWAELLARVRRFAADLRARRFDLALDGQGLLKSGLMAWLSGAPRRIGLGSREGSQWLMTERLSRQGPQRPEDVVRLPEAVMSREYRWLALHLGADPLAWRLSLAVGDAQRSRARQRRSALGLPRPGDERPLALLAAFTTRPQKHWFEERWSALARQLMAQGWAVALLGGPADREAALRMVTSTPGLVSLAGELALDESMASIAEAQLLVGVDTGLTHMGAAFAVPTVALFGSTRPYLQAGVPGFEVLYQPMPCSPCRRRPTCAGRFDCMRHWEVDAVLDAVQRVTAAATPSVPPGPLGRPEPEPPR